MPTPTPTSARLSAITHHLDTSRPSAPPPHAMSESSSKPPITCHVLDTTIGRPAANIPVTLTYHPSSTTSSQSTTSFTALTNADGRVTSWAPSTPFSSTSLADLYASVPGDQKWALKFDTEQYFGARGIEAFFPEVEVRFLIREEKKGEHYHVPVLLGPFGYTTYRGS